MSKIDKFFSDDKGQKFNTNNAIWDAGVMFNRTNALPLDQWSVFESLDAAEAYLTAHPNGGDACAYPGQIIGVNVNGSMAAYIIDADGETGLKLVKLALTSGSGDVQTDIDTLSGMIDDLDAKIDDVSTETTELINDVSSVITADVEELSVRQAWLSTELSTAIDGLTTDLDQSIEDISVALSEEISNLATSTETSVATLNEKIDDAITEYTQADSDLSDAINTLVNTTSVDLEGQIADLSSSISGTVDTIVEEIDDKIADLSTALGEGIDGLDSIVSVDTANGLTITVELADGKLTGVSATLDVSEAVNAGLDEISNVISTDYVTKEQLATSVTTTELSATNISADNLVVDNATFNTTTATIADLNVDKATIAELSVSDGDALSIGGKTFKELVTDSFEALSANVEATGTAEKSGTFAIAGITEKDGKLSVIESTEELEVTANKVSAITDETVELPDAYPTVEAVSSFVFDKVANLAGAMHFEGVVVGNTLEEAIAAKTGYVPEAGDIVLYGTKEFVYDDTVTPAKWVELGDEGIYATQANLSLSVDNLSTRIDDLESDLALSADALSTRIDGVEEDLTLSVSNLSTVLTALEDKVDTGIEDISGAVDALVNTTSVDLEGQIADLSSALSGDIDTEVDRLDGRIDTVSTDLTTLIDDKLQAFDSTISVDTGNGLTITIDQIDGQLDGVSATLDVSEAVNAGLDEISNVISTDYVTKELLSSGFESENVTITNLSATNISADCADLEIVEASIGKMDVNELSAGTLSVADASDIKVGNTTLSAMFDDLVAMMCWYDADDNVIDTVTD